MKQIEQIVKDEQIVFDVMEWMEERIKAVVEEIMKQNKERRMESSTNYDWGYEDGTHDTLLDILNAFDIQTDEEYSYTVH